MALFRRWRRRVAWFTEGRVGFIACIDRKGQIAEIASPHLAPLGMAVGPDGNIWFTVVDGNSIAFLTP